METWMWLAAPPLWYGLYWALGMMGMRLPSKPRRESSSDPWDAWR